MNSFNPVFPDYILHNTNVWSVIDNFSFKKNPNGPNLFENEVRRYNVTISLLAGTKTLQMIH